MKAALLLLTCDRPELTQLTVDSLLRHVDLSRFTLLHGDDCSSGNRNKKIISKAGFKTVVQTSRRMGVAYMWRNLIKAASLQGVDWIVMQENDWEWVRPFPFDALEYAHSREDIYYMRFFGQYKERDNKRPCSKKHMIKKTIPVWDKLNNGWEIGDIHWGFPANATRMKEALKITRDITSEGGAWRNCLEINKLTMRPVENYQFHIGENKTNGFKA